MRMKLGKFLILFLLSNRRYQEGIFVRDERSDLLKLGFNGIKPQLDCSKTFVRQVREVRDLSFDFRKASIHFVKAWFEFIDHGNFDRTDVFGC